MVSYTARLVIRDKHMVKVFSSKFIFQKNESIKLVRGSDMEYKIR